MVQPLLKKIQTIGAKVETVIGTPETLTAADGSFNAYNIEWQGDITINPREGQGGFDMLPGVPGPAMGTLTFRTDVEWDGSATLPTWATTLLPACRVVDNANVFNPKSKAPGPDAGDPKTLTMATR